MRYITVCSGIEAPSMGWKDLPWTPVFFSEIEKFPCAVLNHHYPDVPNLGDMNYIHEKEEFKAAIGTTDLICGGTPCQSFSIAGLRRGLDDPRGNLALVFLSIVDRIRPQWVFWENVPGVLSSWTGPNPPSDLEPGQEWESEETSDLGCFLAALQEIGYGYALRVLDAQYFGLAQRRERVFVVGYLGDWRPPAAVLFESQSMRRHSPPIRKKRSAITREITPGLASGCKGPGHVKQQDAENGMLQIVSPLRSSSSAPYGDDTSDVPPLVFQANASGMASMNPSETTSPTLDVGKAGGMAVFTQNTRNEVRFEGGDGQIVGAQGANEGAKQKSYLLTDQVAFGGNNKNQLKVSTTLSGKASPRLDFDSDTFIQSNKAIRRLTPREWERLQGFPDDFTKIPYKGKPASKCKDGPRYKALGNSMPVPVLKWIGGRTEKVNNIMSSLKSKV